MLKAIFRYMAAFYIIFFVAHQASADDPAVLKTQSDRESYSVGVEMGRNLMRQGMKVDPAVVARGMKDAVAGSKLLLTDEEITSTMSALTSELRAKRAKTRLLAAEDNRKAGEAFMLKNKTREGVVSLPSGLQYKILRDGSGRKPSETDTVELRYRGTLVDGTQFDDVDQPVTFKVADKNLIPGLREALKLMRAGSEWQLFVPYNLAYGQRGAGRLVGPNATLIYDLELLGIK